MNRIELRGITVPGCDRQLDLSIPEGNICVLSASNADNTTKLLRMIAGFEQPIQGTVFLNDVCVFDWVQKIVIPPSERNLQMIFSKPALIPLKSAAQNIVSIFEKSGRFQAKKDPRAVEVLNFLGLDEVAGTPVCKLSRWKRFGVQLARALVSNSDLIIVEDPFSRTDAETIHHIVGLLRRVSRIPGMTLVIGAADPTILSGLANQIVIATENALQIGTAAEFYRAPVCIEIARRIGCPSINLLEGVVQLQREYLTVQSALGIWQFPLDDPSIQPWERGLFHCVVGVRAQEYTFRCPQETEESGTAEEQLICVDQCLDTYFTTDSIRRLDGEGVCINYQPSLFVASGDQVLLHTNRNHACIFDKETGQLIKGYFPPAGTV